MLLLHPGRSNIFSPLINSNLCSLWHSLTLFYHPRAMALQWQSTTYQIGKERKGCFRSVKDVYTEKKLLECYASDTFTGIQRRWSRHVMTPANQPTVACGDRTPSNLILNQLETDYTNIQYLKGPYNRSSMQWLGPARSKALSRQNFWSQPLHSPQSVRRPKQNTAMWSV